MRSYLGMVTDMFLTITESVDLMVQKISIFRLLLWNKIIINVNGTFNLINNYRNSN